MVSTLVSLFPADFRGEFGSQMEADFDDQHHDAADRGRRATASLWTRTVVGFLRVGPREHTAQILADVRHGLRLALRQPGSSLASALVLGLGIAAVTGGFTIVDAFLLRPLPFADPSRLVHVWSTHAPTSVDSGAVPYRTLKRGQRPARYQGSPRSTTQRKTSPAAHDRSASLRRACRRMRSTCSASRRGLVAASCAARIAPGRLRSRSSAAVCGAEARRRGPRIGATLEIGGRRHAVVGVMSQSFVFPLPVTEVWLPYVFDPAVFTWQYQPLQAVARLATGANGAATEAELSALTRAVAQPFGEAGAHRGVRLESLRSALNFADEGFRIAGPVMMFAASLILLAACANVSSVLLGRAITRAREVAVRSAVGASRLRLFRQFLFESVSMSIAALLIGLTLAQWWLWWVQGLLPLDLYRVGEIRIDPRTIAVATAAAALAVLVSAGLPAIRFGKADLLGVLRMDGTSSTVSPRAARLQSGLLIAQVTFSVALLASALVALGVVRDLSGRQPGFDRDRVLTMKFMLGPERYPNRERASVQRTRARRGRQVPGVEAAALVNHLPLNHEANLCRTR